MIRRLGLVFLLVWACAISRRTERMAALTPDGQALFARYRQFMTEGQIDQFLGLQTDLARQQYVEGLKIDQMLEQFAKPIQDAIWGQQVMLGMTRAAVLLSWGGPYMRAFDEDQLGKGNEIERWYYKRFDKEAYVTFTNGIVSDFDDGTHP